MARVDFVEPIIPQNQVIQSRPGNCYRGRDLLLNLVADESERNPIADGSEQNEPLMVVDYFGSRTVVFVLAAMDPSPMRIGDGSNHQRVHLGAWGSRIPQSPQRRDEST